MAILPSWAIHRSPCDVYVHSKTPQMFFMALDVPFISLASTMRLVYINCVYRDILYIYTFMCVYIYVYIMSIYSNFEPARMKSRSCHFQELSISFSNISWVGDPIFPGHLSKPTTVSVAASPLGTGCQFLMISSPTVIAVVFCGTFFWALDLRSCNVASLCFVLRKAWHFWDYHITFWNTNAVRC